MTDVSKSSTEASVMLAERSAGTEELSEERRNLAAFLRPRSVAVIGASDDPGRVGGMPLHFLRAVGFPGEVYPVNPRRESVQGEKAYPGLAAVGAEVDLAVVALPADLVVDAVQECADHGVRAAVVFSAGFAETDEAGERRQTELAEVVRRTGIRVVGPNCAGIMSIPSRLTASFGSHLAADASLLEGRISVVSQSGAVGAYLFTLARQQGVGLAHWVTTGNEADVTVADFVEVLAHDDDTDVIAVYLEQVREVDTLMRACTIAHERGKRLVGVLAGRTDASSEALRSHTASLAGDRDVAAAALEELGILLVDSVDDLLSRAIAVSQRKQPVNAGIGVITISGAAGIMTVDRASERGLLVPTLSQQDQDRLRALLPFAGTSNPVDVTGNISNQPEVFAPFLDTVLSYDRIGGVVCFLGHVLLSPHVGERLLRDVIDAARKTEKPIWLAGLLPNDDRLAELSAAGVMLVTDPVMAVDLHAENVRAGRRTRPEIVNRRRTVNGAAPPVPAAEQLTEVAAQDFFRAAGVEFPRQWVVTSADEATSVVGRFDGPVVMKIVSPDIQHKSDIGGVRVGVRAEDAAETYETIRATVAEHVPDADIEGVLIQEMVDGHPVIVGIKNDPDFGPVVLVGSGGVYTEVLRDRAIALAPVDRVGADALIEATTLPSFLGGLRGGQPLARSELVDLIVNVSELAWRARDHIGALELNPVLVSESRATAVDALIETRGTL